MIDAAALARIAAVSVSSFCDADPALVPADPAIGLVVDHGPVAGPARVVDARTGPKPVLAALEAAAPGDVVVVAGHDRRAVLGELYAAEAARAGVAAILVDGLCRDRARLADAGVTIYARAATPRAGLAGDEAGAAVGSVAFGGLTVRDGDVVVADRDGIVAAAPQRLLAALAVAEAIERDEGAVLAAVRDGAPLRARLDAIGRPEA